MVTKQGPGVGANLRVVRQNLRALSSSPSWRSFIYIITKGKSAVKSSLF